MKVWHQKEMLRPDFPFRLWIVKNMDFSPHWHQEIEVVYVLEGIMQVGLNDKIYTLKAHDIFIIGGGEVHYFLSHSQPGQAVLVQFGLSLFDTYSDVMSDRRFVKPLLEHSTRVAGDVDIHREAEKQILLLVDEYKKKLHGFQMALKARLYDLMIILLRYVPTKRYSVQEKTEQLICLERLEEVFQYVEEYYRSEISLESISKVANFSVYHFTRFFKDTTGMSFGQYLSNFRIRKAERYLMNIEDSITEVAYKAGFNSIKTFNRVFKQLKGCSPTEYRKNKSAISEE